MSLTSITKTCCDPFFCLTPGCDSLLQKGRRCSVCSKHEDIRHSPSSELSQNATPFDEASRHIKVLNTDISPSTSTLSYPDMYEEPLTTQALTIDFTPVEGEDDNQIVIKKCIDFWDFIENNPKLKKFCAMPDPSQVKSCADRKEEEKGEDKEEDKEEDSMESYDKGYEKDQALYWINNDNRINNTLANTALKARPCEPRRSNFSIGHDSSARRRGRADAVNLRRSLEGKPERTTTPYRTSSQLDVQKLCKEMQEWDLTHPKSMLPPCIPPPLIHAVLQRNTST